MFTEDLTPFFAEFGVDVAVGGATVLAIFDNAYDVAALGPRGMSTTGPRLTLPTAAVPLSAYGTPVAVPGHGNFTVTEHQPDGTGLSVLLLEAAA